jgi:hypothetical protein
VIVLLVFMLAIVGLSVWEVHGGPRWRAPVMVGACAVLALAFLSQRVL